MSHVFKRSLTAVCAAFLVTSALASPEAPGVQSQAKNATEAISTPHKLLKTYFDTDSASTTLSVGFNPVGTTLTVNCANVGGCTIAANMNAQLAAAATENTAALCLRVDSAYVNCPMNSIIRPGSGFQVMSYQTFTTVAQGLHTVEMHAYTTQATTLYRWNKEIKLYTP